MLSGLCLSSCIECALMSLCRLVLLVSVWVTGFQDRALINVRNCVGWAELKFTHSLTLVGLGTAPRPRTLCLLQEPALRKLKSAEDVHDWSQTLGVRIQVTRPVLSGGRIRKKKLASTRIELSLPKPPARHTKDPCCLKPYDEHCSNFVRPAPLTTTLIQ